ncbi:MAG: hypothetical protein ACR2J8_05950, partial [Thermomicrobiales bacterium]
MAATVAQVIGRAFDIAPSLVESLFDMTLRAVERAASRAGEVTHSTGQIVHATPNAAGQIVRATPNAAGQIVYATTDAASKVIDPAPQRIAGAIQVRARRGHRAADASRCRACPVRRDVTSRAKTLRGALCAHRRLGL